MSEKFSNNYLRKSGKYSDSVLEQKKRKGKKGAAPTQMELINLRYDLTPHHYLSMIVCEFGNIPPHSVPNVIKEMAKQLDDDDEFEESSSDE